MLILKPQIILDAICNEVGTHNIPLFVGWSIGQRAAVASIIAERFGTDANKIDLHLQRLIEDGWLTTDTQIPDSYTDGDKEHLAITHEGWLTWTYYEKIYLGDLDFESVEEWITDGIKNTTKDQCVEIFSFTKSAKNRVQNPSIDDPWSSSMDEPIDLEE